MEGIPEPKRFSKSNFYVSSKQSINKNKTDYVPQNSVATHLGNSEVENFSEHTNNSIDKLELPVLSQASTQPDIEIMLRSSTYTMEESEDEAPQNQEVPNAEKNPLKSKQPSKKPSSKLLLLTNLQKSSIYTCEENDSPSEETPKNPNKKLKILTDLQKNPTYTCEENDSPSESSENQHLPKKRSRKFKKVYKAPLKKLNNMIDILNDPEVFVSETPGFQSDDEIEFEVVEKQKSNKFLEKIKISNEKSEKVNFRFAKSILYQEKNEENLEVKAPQNLVGFFVRKPTLTARDSLREQLRNEIINRKTLHIEPESVFSKLPTELEGKKKVKKESESESEDYVPDNDEALQAMEIEEMIKLEEGLDENSSDIENSSETEKSSEVEKEEVSEKDEKMQENHKVKQEIPENHEIQSKPEKINENSGQGKENSGQLSETSENDSKISSKSSNRDPSSKSKPYEKSTTSKCESSLPRKLIDPSTAASENSPAIQKVFSKSTFLNKFLEKEAEIGSDHEEHDDLIKKINDSESESEQDQDLEEIIDRQAVDENNEKIQEKHLSQVLKDDEDQIKKVINAEFRKKRKDFDFVDGSNILTKKEQLLEEKKKMIQARGFNLFSFQAGEKVELDGIDDDEIGKYQVMKNSQELKVFRKSVEQKKIFDDQSLSLLSLISEPEKTVKNKSLIVDSEKSSLRVFKTTENFSSNRSFVFSKEKKKSLENVKEKPRNTKLFSLFSR
jgi:hypothetical protein